MNGSLQLQIHFLLPNSPCPSKCTPHHTFIPHSSLTPFAFNSCVSVRDSMLKPATACFTIVFEGLQMFHLRVSACNSRSNFSSCCGMAALFISICPHSAVSVHLSRLHQASSQRLCRIRFVCTTFADIHTCIVVAIAVFRCPSAFTRLRCRRDHIFQFGYRLREYLNHPATCTRRIFAVTELPCLVRYVY